MGAQLGAARLLYGMGRSNALPRGFFGVVDAKRHVPRNNVIFVGVVALIGAFFIHFDLGAEMLNFGALIAFMGVNAASFVRYYLRASEKKLVNFLPPVLGRGLPSPLAELKPAAQKWGALWMLVGIAFGAWKTHGFRGKLIDFDLPPEEG